ncbi:hypothetical protein ACQEVZ_24680 [Dactylosporangium sp. CA-152071]|uniref:hypothetical protein n=1 Tax=Dactylosporangium sp. CA-152071 TaxID=3239933 RepID=UPI003D8D54DB
MSGYDDEAEHECPTALEWKVDEMHAPGLIFTPAGRWETIVSRTPHGEIHAQVTVTTDRCVWRFWRSDKHPYVDGWKAQQQRCVVVNEGVSHMEVVVATGRGYSARGHVLASAHQVRGAGWQIQDQPSGAGDVECVTVASKAKARSEMNRRARAHAKRVGLPVWRDDARPAAAAVTP